MIKNKFQPERTTTEPPEDMVVPFSMIYASVWELFSLKRIDIYDLTLFALMYRKVNPHSGTGIATYKELCESLEWKPTTLNINKVTKRVNALKTKHRLVWFPSHSGSTVFVYAIHNFKLARKSEKYPEEWVDLSCNFAEPAKELARQAAEAAKNQGSEVQRLSDDRVGDFNSVGALMNERRNRVERPSSYMDTQI